MELIQIKLQLEKKKKRKRNLIVFKTLYNSVIILKKKFCLLELNFLKTT